MATQGSGPSRARGRRTTAASDAAPANELVTAPADEQPPKTSLILPGSLEESAGYSARVFAQVALPQRNPGDKPYIERTDGNLKLTLEPGLIALPGQPLTKRYPFGVYPRLALTYVSTEAFLSKSRTIDLGNSMRSFLSRLGVEYSGKTNRAVKEQLAALFSSKMTIRMIGQNSSGYGTAAKDIRFAEGYSLWWANDESEGSDGLWGSSVELSERFYESIVDNPVPVDLRTLRSLGPSPLRIDIYLWASHQAHSLEAPITVGWDALYSQFGSQYGRARAFKAPFVKALDDVQKVFPQLNVEVNESGVIVRPTLSHIASGRTAKSLGSTAKNGS